jgi:hypothetical protein
MHARIGREGRIELSLGKKPRSKKCRIHSVQKHDFGRLCVRLAHAVTLRSLVCWMGGLHVLVKVLLRVSETTKQGPSIALVIHPPTTQQLTNSPPTHQQPTNSTTTHQQPTNNQPTTHQQPTDPPWRRHPHAHLLATAPTGNIHPREARTCSQPLAHTDASSRRHTENLPCAAAPPCTGTDGCPVGSTQARGM